MYYRLSPYVVEEYLPRHLQLYSMRHIRRLQRLSSTVLSTKFTRASPSHYRCETAAPGQSTAYSPVCSCQAYMVQPTRNHPAPASVRIINGAPCFRPLRPRTQDHASLGSASLQTSLRHLSPSNQSVLQSNPASILLKALRYGSNRIGLSDTLKLGVSLCKCPRAHERRPSVSKRIALRRKFSKASSGVVPVQPRTRPHSVVGHYPPIATTTNALGLPKDGDG